MGRKSKDYSKLIHVGRKFGRLTVIELPEKLIYHSIVTCRCDCGNEIQVYLYNLILNHTRSCSCIRKDYVKKAQQSSVKSRIDRSIFHGDYGSNEYWKIVKYFQGMHNRSNSKYYKSKGRIVHDVWSYTSSGYNNFKSWLLSELKRLNLTLDDFNSMHNHELSVDRVDNELGYFPENSRLATPKQQNRNKSNSRKYLGKHIFDYAEELGIPYKLAIDYYYRNEFGKLLDYFNPAINNQLTNTIGGKLC